MSMTNFFVREGTKEEKAVIQTEVLFSDFVVQHNLCHGRPP